jgi:hypothetical protein
MICAKSKHFDCGFKNCAIEIRWRANSMKSHFSFHAAVSGAVLCASAVTSLVSVQAADSNPLFVDQGPNWTSTTRASFYIQDQGSRIIQLSWLEALRQSDGSPFLADSLSRYGYLPTPPITMVCW